VAKDLTERVKARNKIAETCVAKEGISVDDLYGLVESHSDYFSQDGVHFNAQGIAAQSRQVAQRILENLQ
jgi:lysophospholipase L1-like esterase